MGVDSPISAIISHTFDPLQLLSGFHMCSSERGWLEPQHGCGLIPPHWHTPWCVATSHPVPNFITTLCTQYSFLVGAFIESVLATRIWWFISLLFPFCFPHAHISFSRSRANKWLDKSHSSARLGCSLPHRALGTHVTCSHCNDYSPTWCFSDSPDTKVTEYYWHFCI